MDRSASLPLQQQAARALAHYRNELRVELGRMNNERVVPQPVYPRVTVANKVDENMENMETISNSAVASDTDTDTTTDDSESDLCMDNEGDTSPEEGHMLVEDQNHVEHLEFIRAIAQRIDMSENVAIGADDSDEDIDAYLYPDPELSEMIPPPTPTLHYVVIPPSSNATTEVQMGDSEEGDLSNITHLMPAHQKSSFSSNRMRSQAIKVNIDKTSYTEPSIEMDISEILPCERQHRATPRLKSRQKPSLVHVATDRAQSMRCSTADSSDKTSTRQLSLLNSANGQASTTMKDVERHQEHNQSTALNRLPGVGPVAVHTDILITSSLPASKHDTLAKQAPAAELTMPNLNLTTADREGMPDPVLDRFMEDVEEMEPTVPADVDVQRRLLCRAHTLPASKHYPSWHPTYPARERFCLYNKPREVNRNLPQIQRARGLKNRRQETALWERHSVWKRSLLCAETKMPPLDHTGEYRTWHIFHTGRGPTGGDPCLQFWRHCKGCGESLNAVWEYDRRDHSGRN